MSKKPTALVLESSTSPTQKDPVPVLADMAARPNGTCAVTRYEGVVVFTRGDSGYESTYVETKARNTEIALDANGDRFVIWSKRFATISRKLEVSVFSRTESGAYERSTLWESREVGPFPLPLHPIAAAFAGDRVAVAMYVPGEPEGHCELWAFARDGEGYERKEVAPIPNGLIATSDARWVIVHRRAGGWNASLVSFGESITAVDAALAIEPHASVKTAATDGSLLVLGDPDAAPGGSTNEGSARIFSLEGDVATLVKTVGPAKSKKYSGFGAIPSVCNGRAAIASFGWERAPKGGQFVPRQSVTSVFDASGELLAQGEPRTVPEPSRTWRHTHVAITRDLVLEMHGGEVDALKAFRLPSP